MDYKYIIRKIVLNGNVKYVTLIWNRNNWKYLIVHDDTFMVYRKTKSVFNDLNDAYKFIASHRMNKGLSGKDIPKCLYFNDTLSMIPFIGLFYTLPKLHNKVPLKYLFTTPVILGISLGIQLVSIILLLILPSLI